MSGAETEGLAVTMARVEGKLDAYAARTTAVEQRVDDLDVRLRTAATEDDVRAIDDRLRTQEARPVVTTPGLVGALLATVTLVGGFVAVVDRLNGFS